MFSETGNWVNDIFDGVVAEYDILTKKNWLSYKKIVDAAQYINN